MINHNYSNYYSINQKIARLPHVVGGGFGHSGSWLNLPDFGITEALGGLISKGKTTDLSNALSNKSSVATLSQPNYTPAPNSTPVNGGGSVLSASTSKLPSNSIPTNSLSTPSNQNIGSPAAAAAQSQTYAALQEQNTLYDQTKETLQGQLGYLGTQKDQSLNELNTALTGVTNQVNKSKADSLSNFTDQSDDAYSNAQATQLQNRNILRALGIINSSAAGDMLTRPLTEYDKTRVKLYKAHSDRINELDDVLTQKTQENANSIKALESQYTNLVEGIQKDLRFNERQRIDAVKSANAALQQRLAEIQTQQATFEQAASAQKQNSLIAIAQLQQYNNPTADISGITNQLIQNVNGGNQPSTVGIAQDATKKKPDLLPAYS